MSKVSVNSYVLGVGELGMATGVEHQQPVIFVCRTKQKGALGEPVDEKNVDLLNQNSTIALEFRSLDSLDRFRKYLDEIEPVVANYEAEQESK